jgi:hypothetical protein
MNKRTDNEQAYNTDGRNVDILDGYIAQMNEVSDVVGWCHLSILWRFAASYCNLKTRLVEFVPREGHKDDDAAMIKRWEQQLDDYTDILAYAFRNAQEDLVKSAQCMVELFTTPSDYQPPKMLAEIATLIQEDLDLDDEEFGVFTAASDQDATEQAERRRLMMVKHQEHVVKSLDRAMNAELGPFEISDQNLLRILNILAEKCNTYRFSKLKLAGRQRKVENAIGYIADAKVLKGIQPSIDKAAHELEQQLEATREVSTETDVDGRTQHEMH